MGHEAIWGKPRTRIPDHGHRKYPYLLGDLKVTRPEPVWCIDITDVPMPGGPASLRAVMDWYSRKVLGWAVSNTMETGLCLEALENAMTATGRIPKIFNTDQGCQFPSAEWSGRLLDLGIKIGMDGRGRWMDKVFIERLWRTIKDEEIYLFEHSTVAASEVEGGGGEMVGSRQRLAARCDDWQVHPGDVLSQRSQRLIRHLERPPRRPHEHGHPSGRRFWEASVAGSALRSALLRAVHSTPAS
jgi:transposase InsO family protein